MVWPDADDYYSCSTAISELVKVFGRLDDSYGIVRCEQNFVDEDTLKVISGQNIKLTKNIFSRNILRLRNLLLWRDRIC